MDAVQNRHVASNSPDCSNAGALKNRMSSRILAGEYSVRFATLADINNLAQLELRCFDMDILNARNFRHLISRGHAALMVAETEAVLIAYVLVLFHRNTSMARMYSLAVDPEYRGQGIAERLIHDVENEALSRGVVSMRLEVRRDNRPALKLYQTLGYREFAVFPGYYEDHMDALRLEKALAPHLKSSDTPVPFYAQSLEFTCGPACLMMAMGALDKDIKFDRRLELRLWREATTIFMTSGHGGCDPYGLALSAHRRGFQVRLYAHFDVEMFTSSVRNEEKRQVIRIVSEDFHRELKSLHIPVSHSLISIAQMEKHFRQGAIPIVLISAYRLTGDKAPHWVVVAGFDERFIYIHEPYVDIKEGCSETTCLGIPVPREEFERMMRYGRSRYYAALMISKRSR